MLGSVFWRCAVVVDSTLLQVAALGLVCTETCRVLLDCTGDRGVYVSIPGTSMLMYLHVWCHLSTLR